MLPNFSQSVRALAVVTSGIVPVSAGAQSQAPNPHLPELEVSDYAGMVIASCGGGITETHSPSDSLDVQRFEAGLMDVFRTTPNFYSEYLSCAQPMLEASKAAGLDSAADTAAICGAGVVQETQLNDQGGISAIKNQAAILHRTGGNPVFYGLYTGCAGKNGPTSP